MDGKQTNSKRRFFLTAATCVPALAVAVLATRRQEIVQETPPAAAVEPETSVGYHETEHIRNYYSTAAYF